MFGQKIWKMNGNRLELDQTALDNLMKDDILIATPEPNQSGTRWHARYKTAKLFLAIFPILTKMKEDERYTSHNHYLKGGLEKMLPNSDFLEIFTHIVKDSQLEAKVLSKSF